MIIALNGYAGVGKDVVGTMIQYLICKPGKPSIEEVIANKAEHEWWLEEGSNWEIKKFSNKLKIIAAIMLGLDDESIFEDQKFKDSILGSEWSIPSIVTTYEGKTTASDYKPMTVREFLQRLGTNAIRNGLHENAWMNAAFAEYKPIKEVTKEDAGYNNEWFHVHKTKFPNWIFTDCRFPNEAQKIKELGGIIIRIDRPGVKPANNHPSEIALDDWKFDYKIANVSDLTALMFTVEGILKHAKIPYNHGPAK